MNQMEQYSRGCHQLPFLTWKLSMYSLCTTSGGNKTILYASRSFCSGVKVAAWSCVWTLLIELIYASFTSSVFPPMAYVAPQLYP